MKLVQGTRVSQRRGDYFFDLTVSFTGGRGLERKKKKSGRGFREVSWRKLSFEELGDLLLSPFTGTRFSNELLERRKEGESNGTNDGFFSFSFFG